jgi:hypothetical protein
MTVLLPRQDTPEPFLSSLPAARWALAVGFFSLCGFPAPAAEKTRPPNVLFILTDEIN